MLDLNYTPSSMTSHTAVCEFIRKLSYHLGRLNDVTARLSQIEEVLRDQDRILFLSANDCKFLPLLQDFLHNLHWDDGYGLCLVLYPSSYHI